jgi:hypothetical protein
VLGHRLGVRPLGARPRPGVVDQTGFDGVLDAGEGKLDPADLGLFFEDGRQTVEIVGGQPHQGVGLFTELERHSAPRPHGVLAETGAAGADGDPRSGHG